jgi:hypothetical protein
MDQSKFAHDIGNLLAIASGMTNIAKKTLTQSPSEIPKALEKIEKALNALQRMELLLAQERTERKGQS